MFLIVELLFIVLLTMILFMIYKNERALARKIVPQARMEGYLGGKERRQCVRFRQDMEVHYIVEKKNHLKNRGKTVDISESGVRLLLDEKLATGTILDLKMILPGSRRSVDVEGEVVWTEEIPQIDGDSGKRLFHAGVKFLAVRSHQGAMVTDYLRSISSDSYS